MADGASLIRPTLLSNLRERPFAEIFVGRRLAGVQEDRTNIESLDHSGNPGKYPGCNCGGIMTNRVHIDAPAGVVEIEGEKDFVEGLLGKLFPLIEEVGFGSRPRSTVSTNPIADPVSDVADEVLNEATTTEISRKRIRKSVKQPPTGQSCPARIQILKDDGFFKEHRSPADIVAALKAKGWTHNQSQVGAATSQMFGKGTIQRTKVGKGPWRYYWDRV